MKKILVPLILVFITLTGCSDDNNSKSRKGLFQTKQTTFFNGAPEEIIISNFDDGKMRGMEFYDWEDELVFTTSLQYNTAGLLTKVTSNDPQGQEGFSTEYIYDSQQRLKTIQHNSGAYSYTVNYTFNNDNTISATHSENPLENKTFHLNGAGLIYRETANSGYYEITYDGPNAVSATNGSGIKTFTYDNEHNPALLPHQTIQDSYKANAVLRARYLFDAETSTANKYLISETGPGENITYVRTFNADGLPTLLKCYSNDLLFNQIEYFYN